MNMNALMQQAQRMQKDMEKKQNEIYNSEYTGSSEWVDITINGKKKVLSVKMKNVKTIEEDDLEVLEDMIKIALNSAVEQVEKDVDSKMGVYAKQLGGLM